MVDWQITATTIYCDDIDDEVTLMVYSDGASKCSGELKHARPDKEGAKALKKRSKQAGRTLGCRTAECFRIQEYRNKWLGK